MFSAWDFHSWIFSISVMLFLLSLLTGVDALVTVLMSRIWGEATDHAATARMNRKPEEAPFHKAA